MELLKKLKDGKPVLFETGKDIIHPATGKKIQEGDFQYWIGDSIMKRNLLRHMPTEFMEAEMFVSPVREKTPVIKVPVEKEKPLIIEVIEPKPKTPAPLPPAGKNIVFEWRMKLDDMRAYAESKSIDSTGGKKELYARIKAKI